MIESAGEGKWGQYSPFLLPCLRESRDGRMKNPFLPLPVKISKIKVETDDGRIKSFDLQFIDEEEAARFKYMPGQFVEVSVLGVGEAPMGIASSPVEEESLRITVTAIEPICVRRTN